MNNLNVIRIMKINSLRIKIVPTFRRDSFYVLMLVVSFFLINSVKKISKEFPILKEAKREVLEDLMDIQKTKLVLDWINSEKVKISYHTVKLPSPFALGLILQGHMDLMKIEDKQQFLQRMHKVYMDEILKKNSKNKVDEFDYEDFLEEYGK